MLKKIIPLVLGLALIIMGVQTAGSAAAQSQTRDVQSPAVEKKNVLKGKIENKSNKAKLLTIATGKPPQTVNLKFDENTQGLDQTNIGEIVIIKFRDENGEKIINTIEPDLLSAPPGATAVDSAYVEKLINGKADYVLIDSRPPARFNWGAIPTAVSIPYATMKTEEDALKVLPEDKGKEVIFYCQGFT